MGFFIDLPDELICYIGLYLPRRDILSYFLIDRNIRGIIQKCGFFELKVKLLGIRIDYKKVSDFKELYIRSLRRIRYEFHPPELKILKSIQKSKQTDRICYETKNRLKHVDMKDPNSVTLLKDIPTTIVFKPIVSLERESFKKRRRCLQFDFRVIIKSPKFEIGFYEKNSKNYFDTNVVVRDGLSFLFSKEVDSKSSSQGQQSRIEMYLEFVEEHLDRRYYSVRFQVNGKHRKFENCKSKVRHNTELLMFIKLNKIGEKIRIDGCHWTPSSLKMKLENTKKKS